MTYVKVGTIQDIPDKKMKEYRVNGKVVAVANIKGQFKAFDGFCTHAHCSLAGGFLDGSTLTCYCHGAQFDISNGKVLAPPATTDLNTYPVKLEGNDILVGIKEE